MYLFAKGNDNKIFNKSTHLVVTAPPDKNSCPIFLIIEKGN